MGDDSPTCVWAEDADGNCFTECGKTFARQVVRFFSDLFEWDGPDENRYRFCCACGKRLTAKPYQPPPADDE